MIKSIVSGGGMLVAALAFLVGITGLINMTSAALVSWGALFAVAFILFAAFGGFKPFFSPLAQDAAQNDQSGLANLEGQDQAISRRLVTVGAEDETEGVPLFGDRSPIVSQPAPPDSPLFGDATGRIGRPESPTKPPGFGDALGERLAGDREEHQSGDTGDGQDAPVDEVSSEIASQRDADAELDLAPPLVTEAAPWVAARNEARLEQSPAPHIEVEESPSWMRPSDDKSAPESEDSAELTEESFDEIAIEEAADAGLASPFETESDTDTAEATIEDEAAEDLDDTGDLHSTDDLHSAGDLHSTGAEPDAATNVELEEITASEDDRAGVDDSADDDAAADEIDAEGSVDDEILEDEDVTDELQAVAAVIPEENGSAQLPVVVTPPAPLEIQKYSPSEIMAVVRTQESELVDTLIDEGVLTTSGPITDRDVRTMLFVAVSSNELIDVLTAASGNGDTAELNS